MRCQQFIKNLIPEKPSQNLKNLTLERQIPEFLWIWGSSLSNNCDDEVRTAFSAFQDDCEETCQIEFQFEIPLEL